MNLHSISSEELVKTFLSEVCFKKQCYGILGYLENKIITALQACYTARVDPHKSCGCYV